MSLSSYMDSRSNNFLLFFFLAVILLNGHSATSDLEVKGSKDNSSDVKKDVFLSKENVTSSNELKNGTILDLDHKDEKLKMGSDQLSDLKKENVSSSDSSKVSEPKETRDVQSSKGGSSEGLEVSSGDNKEDKAGGRSEAKEVSISGGDGGDTTGSEVVKNEGSRGEECDPSNMCTDDEDKLVACLRVPANESPHLSLLVQNKGKDPLSVTISAPKYVQLGERNLQLQKKEHKKIKVSIKNGRSDNLIILTAGHGKCSLNFTDLVPRNSGTQSDYQFQFASVDSLLRAPTIAFVSFAALLVLATAWMCIKFRRQYYAGDSSKYQRLDMELPVSGGFMPESDNNEGWDNNWDDSWDDEEASRTPTLPVTPSLSSKGLASRRLNKEGWKD